MLVIPDKNTFWKIDKFLLILNNINVYTLDMYR